MRRGSGVGAKSEKLRLEIYIRREKCTMRAHERGQPQSSSMHFDQKKKKRISVYHIALWWRKQLGFLYFGVHTSIKDLAAGEKKKPIFISVRLGQTG